jgi:hypothetical protein
MVQTATCKQWVEACLAGYGKMEVSSPFETAGPLTEALLMANLAVRGHDIIPKGKPESIKLLWDNQAMKVTNFDEVNQFKRETRVQEILTHNSIINKMNRREALSRVGLILGGTVIGAEFFISGCKSGSSVNTEDLATRNHRVFG